VNLSVQPVTEVDPLNFEIVACLKIQPEEVGCAEVFRETQRSVGTNRSLTLDDLIDPSGRDTDVFCQPILRHAEWTQEFFGEHFAGMDWR
jgi:hypothetical protein